MNSPRDGQVEQRRQFYGSMEFMYTLMALHRTLGGSIGYAEDFE